MPKGQYYFNKQNQFVIQDYNNAKVFSSFLPGIAGCYGIPIWAFYVNRGQGIVSFGVKDKDHSILEFYPANKAYQLATIKGFRTFLKVSDGRDTTFYEPFQYVRDSKADISQNMYVTSHELSLEDYNKELGIRTQVEMFTIPNAPLGGLARKVTLYNENQNAITVDFVDGIPQILPYGLTHWCMKHVSRIMECFTQVHLLDGVIPYIQLKISPQDVAQVTKLVKGNFYVGFMYRDGKPVFLKPIVENRVVFGNETDFVYPKQFANKVLETENQVLENQNPCGFSAGQVKIEPNSNISFYTIFGQGQTPEYVQEHIHQFCNTPGFFEEKQRENAQIINQIKDRAFVCTSKGVFNEYARHTFLDNSLRGGLSVNLSDKLTVYLYGRKHGDLEREYNDFCLQDTQFSQGNGDFRDVVQNRRCELFFNPQMKDKNIKYFFSLIQADGYNPLVIKNSRFFIKDIKVLLDQIEKKHGIEKDMRGALEALFIEEFSLGQLWEIVRDGFELYEARKELLDDILECGEEIEHSEFERGYWSDHWTYLMDFIDNFQAVYPERMHDILCKEKKYTFYDTDRFVLPREKKFILTEKGVRIYSAVMQDTKKTALMEKRTQEKHRVRTKQGTGEVYKTTLVVKLLCLVINKISSLDPFGKGIEMEADKPGWCDALNGLPGLLGSAINETLELKRLVDFLIECLQLCCVGDSCQLSMPKELCGFIMDIDALLQKSDMDSFTFWDKSHSVKEHYRENVFMGFDGAEETVSCDTIQAFLKRASDLLARGIAANKDPQTGLPFTYFINEAVEYDVLDKEEDGCCRVWVREFKQHPVPLFLEGIVHTLKIEKDAKQVRDIYDRVQKTDLYDKKLKMYKMNVELVNETEELGRNRIFSYGWLENGSIFLHMHYKYVLEMVRNGLIDEFYANMQHLLVPFHDPAVYQRSTAENVSFLVSSGYRVDPHDHGRGYVARLSGSTAEFLHIWSVLMFGPQPFKLDAGGNLVLEFSPQLHADLFLKGEITFPHPSLPDQQLTLPKDSLAFRFLGSTLVTYHNPKCKNTFGDDGAEVSKMVLEDGSGKSTTIEGLVISSQDALRVRNGEIRSIDVHLV